MIHGFYFGGLAIRTAGVAGPQFFEFTIELHRDDVYATTALTGVSLGLLHGTPGMANAYIKYYGKIGSTGLIEHHLTPASDVFFNSVYVPQCVYINFRLAAVQAEAGMQGTVWVTRPGAGNANERDQQNFAFDLFDEQGQRIGSQSYSVSTRNSQLDLAERVAAARSELAQARNISPNSITVKQIDHLPAPVVQWVEP